METYQTPYGSLNGIAEFALHQNGTLKECVLNDKSELDTLYGTLIPQYDFENPRKKNNYCISFFASGALRKISLDKQKNIETTIGTVPAELITFYENGMLKRLFPLNGQLTAYWEEQDEYRLAKKMEFDFSFGHVEAKVMAISFYPDGKVKDLTLWPGEMITIQTPIGQQKVRIGLSLYPDGRLRSMEPAYPILLETPIGTISAFDTEASGLSGDKNSLNFTEDGEIKSFVTSESVVHVTNYQGDKAVFSPEQEIDVDGLEVAFYPLQIEWSDKNIILNGTAEYEIEGNEFVVDSYQKPAKNPCSNCAECSHPCA